MDSHTHTTEARWVELFSLWGITYFSTHKWLLSFPTPNTLVRWLAFVYRLKWYLIYPSLNTEQQTLICTTCLSSKNGWNTRALQSILRVEILCSKQDQEPEAIQDSDVYLLNKVCHQQGMFMWSGEMEEWVAMIYKSGQLQQEVFLFGPPLQSDIFDIFLADQEVIQNRWKEIKHSLKSTLFHTLC